MQADVLSPLVQKGLPSKHVVSVGTEVKSVEAKVNRRSSYGMPLESATPRHASLCVGTHACRSHCRLTIIAARCLCQLIRSVGVQPEMKDEALLEDEDDVVDEHGRKRTGRLRVCRLL